MFYIIWICNCFSLSSSQQFRMSLAFRPSSRVLAGGGTVQFWSECRVLSSLCSWFSAKHCNSSSGGTQKLITTIAEELRVIHELSSLSLVPAEDKPSARAPSCSSTKPFDVAKTSTVDVNMLPEDKLVGVFLQKITGKSSIERALTGCRVDLTIDVVSKVMLNGYLGGEAIVLFLEWVLKRQTVPKVIEGYYCVALKALGRKRFFSLMFDTVVSMKRKGINPQNEIFEIVASSLIRADQVRRAVRFFENSEFTGLEKNTQLLNLFLSCLCRRSHAGKANSMLNKMKGRVPFDITTYNLVIGGLSKSGRFRKIKKLIKSMNKIELSPDRITFCHLIEGFGRLGRTGDAVRIFEGMREIGFAPDTRAYNSIISSVARDFEDCVVYYERMKDEQCDPDCETFALLISAALRSRKVADALELFDEMLDRGIVTTTGTLTSFLKPLCSYGPPDAAVLVYKKARKVGCRVSETAYKLLLMRLSRFGRCGGVMKVLRDMRESGYRSDREVYEYVVNVLCNAEKVDDAAIAMDELMDKGFCPSRVIYGKLVNKLLNHNRVEKAHALCLRVEDSRKREKMQCSWRSRGWHF